MRNLTEAVWKFGRSILHTGRHRAPRIIYSYDCVPESLIPAPIGREEWNRRLRIGW